MSILGIEDIFSLVKQKINVTMLLMKILDFAKTVGKLKRVKRTGWVVQNIPEPESVAEHSFRTAVLAMVLADKAGVDKDKVTKMALIHDVGEALIGDILTHKGRQALPILPVKKRKEMQAIKQIFSIINGEEYIKLFQEFEAMKTKEAQFVKQIDRLEFAIQTWEYEKQHIITFPAYYSQWPEEMVKEPSLKTILNEISRLRKKK